MMKQGNFQDALTRLLQLKLVNAHASALTQEAFGECSLFFVYFFSFMEFDRFGHLN